MLECRRAGTLGIAIPTRLNLSFVFSGVRNRLDTVSASKETPFLVCGTDGRLIVLERPVNELIVGSPKSANGAVLFCSFFRVCIEGEELV